MSGEEAQEALVDYDEDVDVEKEDAGETDKLAKVKGRGHREGRRDDRDRGGVFEGVEDDGAGGSGGPAKSVEGWVVMVTGVHEEAQEDEVLDKFSEYGKIKDIQINLDRRTGFVKGYALIEFEKFDEAQAAIKEMDGQELYEKPVKVDWAFVKGSQSGGNVRRRGR